MTWFLNPRAVEVGEVCDIAPLCFDGDGKNNMHAADIFIN